MSEVRYDVGPRGHTLCYCVTQTRDKEPCAFGSNGGNYGRSDGGGDDDDAMKASYPKRVFIRALR